MPESLIDLVLDVGNTRTKIALFSGDRLVRHSAIASGDARSLTTFLQGATPDRIALASVAGEDNSFFDQLCGLAPVLSITGASASPLRSLITTPETLGVDRLANAVAARACFAKRAVLAVDMGTCITYDLVDADGVHRGGAISPGLLMRAKAMHAYSARLPLVVPGPNPGSLGTDTTTAMEAGIHYGILGELKEFIRTYGHQFTLPAVVFTGGDALPFARAMKTGIFAHPFLTLEGLRLILHHQLGGSGLPAGAAPG